MNGLENLFDNLDNTNPCVLICEAYDEYKGAGVQYDRAFRNASALGNRVMRDYELNCKQAKIRCIQESGTEDDLAFFVEAASTGASAKLRKIIDKIIAMWKEIVTKIKHLISTKICTIQAKNWVKKAQNEIRLNPRLSGMTVELIDSNATLLSISQTRARLDKYDAQLIATFSGRQELKGLGDTIADFRTAVGDIPMANAAVIMMTVGALITEIMLDMDKLPTMIKELDESSSVILKRFMNAVDDTMAAEAMGAFQQAANFRVQLNKQECDIRIKWLVDKINALKEAMRNANGVGTTNINVVEDINNDEAYDAFLEEDLFTEGANSEMHTKYRVFRKEYAANMKEAKKAYKSGDYAAAREALKAANKSIDDGIAAIRAVDKSSFTSAFFGSILGLVIGVGKTIAFSIPTFGLGGHVAVINDIMAGMQERAHSANTDTRGVGDSNLYRTQLIDFLKKCKFFVNMMEKSVNTAEKKASKSPKTSDAKAAAVKKDDKKPDKKGKKNVNEEADDELDARLDAFFEEAIG